MSQENNQDNTDAKRYILTWQSKRALELAVEIVTYEEKEVICSEDLLMAMISTIDSGAGSSLAQHSVTRTYVASEIEQATYVDQRGEYYYGHPEDYDDIYTERMMERRFEENRKEWIKANPVEFIKEKASTTFIQGAESFPISQEVKKIFEFAEDIRYQNAPDSGIDTYWLLVGISRDPESNAYALLEKLLLLYANHYFEEVSKFFHVDYSRSGGHKDGKHLAEVKRQEELQSTRRFSSDSYDILGDITLDLTEAARQGLLPKIVGREKEIKSLELALVRRDRNNVVLIGDEGVGKTAIVEGLAQRIADGELASLRDTTLLQFNHQEFQRVAREGLLAASQKLAEALQKDKTVLLFIDDIHYVSTFSDFYRQLKLMMNQNQLRIIGTSSFKEWEAYTDRDRYLRYLFEQVSVQEPDLKESEEIVKTCLPLYENHYQIHYQSEALTSAVRLAKQYLSDSHLPTSALELIDDAGALLSIEGGLISKAGKVYEERINQLNERIVAHEIEDFPDVIAIEQLKEELRQAQYRLKEFQERSTVAKVSTALTVTEDHVKQAVELKTGIPVKDLTISKDDAYLLKKLRTLPQRLGEKIIGQKEAVDIVSKAVIRSKTGFRDPNRPIGIYLFLGTTGVGKTETAKTLAEELFGDPKTMVRFDMSEFQQEHTVSKLIGAPPGYVGFDGGGQLTNKIRRNPYSVILFDEIEKAHSKVFDVLLQVFDDGILTDGSGVTVDFRNTIIILTSNLGAKEIRQDKVVGFGQKISALDYQYVHDSVHRVVKDYFRPEFLNRIDETVIFKPFDDETLLAITKLLIEKEKRLIELNGIKADFDDEAVAFIAQNCSDPENGARPLKRGITRLIEDKLSHLLIHNLIKKGDRLQVGVKDGEIVIDKR